MKFPKSNTNNNSGKHSTFVIHPIMEINQNINQDIIDFKNQLNELYRDGKYEIVFISALRTFVELIVNDIVSKLRETQHEKLSENYKFINKKENIETKFLNVISNSKEKAGIRAIYEQAVNDGRYNGTVRYLNLSTHAVQDIISLKQLKSDFPIINFLFTYLCFLSTAVCIIKRDK